jgi:hypothetical protein
MYSNIGLLIKAEFDGVECRERFQGFTQILYAVISNAIAAKKKREIE